MAAPTVSLADLLQEVGIAEQQLNNRVNDDHLRSVSQFLTSREKIAPFLELDESDMEAIEVEGKGEEDKKLKTLLRWREKNAFKATYRKLIDAFLGLEMENHAEKRTEEESAELRAAIALKDIEIGHLTEKTTKLECELNQIQEEAQQLREQLRKTTNRGDIQSVVVNPIDVATARKHIENLKQEWAKLSTTVCRKLEESGVVIADVFLLVCAQTSAELPDTSSSTYYTLFHSLQASKLLDFLNCNLLWSIIDEYLPRDRALEDQVDVYKYQFQRFQRNTRIIDFIATMLSSDGSGYDALRIRIQDHCQPYTVDMNLDPCEATLMGAKQQGVQSITVGEERFYFGIKPPAELRKKAPQGAHPSQLFGASTITASPPLDLPTVTEYLLDLDKLQVYNLGISLGLSFERVKSEVDTARSTIDLLDGIINSWLKRVDQVDEKGGPSWMTLVAALRSRRLQQTGIAHSIEKDYAC